MNKKLVLSLFLALNCSHVMAEWVKISSSEKSVFYIDSSVSKKVGSNLMVWILRDHMSPRYEGTALIQSSKDQIEVDCNGQRIRRIYSSDHPQRMGAGKAVLSEHGPMSWNDASPNTVIKRIVDIACANR
jgi:hypothetical protein